MPNFIQRLRCHIWDHPSFECRVSIIGSTMEHTHTCRRCKTPLTTTITSLEDKPYFANLDAGMESIAQREFMN